jgi:hypothetical protein
LVARGDEADGGVCGGFFYGLDDVDDGGTGADADVGGIWVKVVFDSLLRGAAFRGFDGIVGHDGRGASEGPRGAWRGKAAG